MVEGQSMTTVADVVGQVRDGRLEDFVREAVVLVARELMEGEISAEIGAELGEIAPEARSTHRNGYRPRGWETRVGEIEGIDARVSHPMSKVHYLLSPCRSRRCRRS